MSGPSAKRAVTTFSEHSHGEPTTPNLGEILDDDCIVAIFVYLYTFHSPVDAICFVKTCKGVNAPFKLQKSGSTPYKECKARFLTRMPVNMADGWPYIAQLAREVKSKNRAAGFFKSCEMLAMHCAADCCQEARREYNYHYAKKYGRLDTVASGVRLVAASDLSDTIFTYGSERVTGDFHARKSTHRTVLRKHGSETGTVAAKDLKMQGMFPSPDGRFLAFTAIDGGRVRVYLWDTSHSAEWPQIGELGVAVSTELTTALQYRHTQCVWWARCPDGAYTLLVAYTARYYDCFCMHMYRADAQLPREAETIVHIVEYGKTPGVDPPKLIHTINVRNTREQDKLQFIGPMHAVGPDLALFYRSYHEQGIHGPGPGAAWKGSFNLMVVDTMGVRRPIQVRTFNPGQLYPPPQSIGEDLEIVHHPMAMALGPTGKYIAVLAEDFKWKCHSDETVMYFVLYTWDEKRNEFTRKLGPKDEIVIKRGPSQLEVLGWELVFSPCGAYVAVTYGLNRYRSGPHTQDNPDESAPISHVAESAVHIIHISPKGLKQSQTIDCPHVRQLAWSSRAVVVMPKHGAVQIH